LGVYRPRRLHVAHTPGDHRTPTLFRPCACFIAMHATRILVYTSIY
jgi:hypothetical protein